MPKKFGTNTKKEEARERKKQKKKDEKEKAEREAEDEYWREKDPKILEKQREKKRKEKEKEEKQKEKQRLKEELKKEEEEILSKKKTNQVSAPTRKQIQEYEQERIEQLKKEKEEEEKKKTQTEEINLDEEFVNENYNKLNKKTESGIGIIEASGIENALQEISLEEYDKHPEKRMRAAWNAFFEKQLPIYKENYPNLKRQQYINMIQKEFKTSPDNPVYMKKIKDAQKEEEKEDEK